MSVTRVSFNNRGDKTFIRDLKKEVNKYFEENNLSKHANAAMVIKTIVLLGGYIFSYLLLISGGYGWPAMLILWFLMGIFMAGIGFSVSHDALHGAYSSNKTVNRLLGYSFDMLGANGYIWKITHNVVHHTYTNIHEHDEDLEVAAFIRLSPHAEYKKVHKAQHYLAFMAYSFATLFWVFIKDYQHFFKSHLGPYENKNHPPVEWVTLVITKLFYYFYILVLPLVLLPITWWQLLIGFIVLHLTAGVILGIIFQLAHVVEGTNHPTENAEGTIENTWAIHQMETTSDFAHKNKALCWYIGGLNYQIEHHLFPRICSIHYPNISKIVQQVAEKHDVPYHYQPSLFTAIRSHYRTLKLFGKSAQVEGMEVQRV